MFIYLFTRYSILHVDKKHTYIYPGAGAGAGFVIWEQSSSTLRAVRDGVDCVLCFYSILTVFATALLDSYEVRLNGRMDGWTCGFLFGLGGG